MKSPPVRSYKEVLMATKKKAKKKAKKKKS
jgi:hypothetical protein